MKIIKTIEVIVIVIVIVIIIVIVIVIIIVIVIVIVIIIVIIIVIVIVIAFNNFDLILLDFKIVWIKVDRMWLAKAWCSFDLVAVYIKIQLSKLCIEVVETFVIVTVN